jgi:hypothetical protein
MLTYLSRHSRWLFAFVFTSSLAAQTAVLQPLAEKPVSGASVKLKSDFYVPATPDSIRWGYLPDNAAKAVVTVPSGATVTFDTVPTKAFWKIRAAILRNILAASACPPIRC